MKRDLRIIINITLLAALTLPQLALAQTYELPVGVVGSGGGTATSTSYSLSGTVGQPAVSDPVSSTSYKNEPGFWPQAQALRPLRAWPPTPAPPFTMESMTISACLIRTL